MNFELFYEDFFSMGMLPWQLVNSHPLERYFRNKVQNQSLVRFDKSISLRFSIMQVFYGISYSFPNYFFMVTVGKLVLNFSQFCMRKNCDCLAKLSLCFVLVFKSKNYIYCRIKTLGLLLKSRNVQLKQLIMFSYFSEENLPKETITKDSTMVNYKS